MCEGTECRVKLGGRIDRALDSVQAAGIFAMMGQAGSLPLLQSVYFELVDNSVRLITNESYPAVYECMHAF